MVAHSAGQLALVRDVNSNHLATDAFE